MVSGPGSDSRTGNALPLGEIPLGTTVHNVELKIGKGGQLARTAGSSAQVVAKEGEYVTLRLRSTEMRLVHGRCLATIGEVGNAEHELLSVGKAGKSRWLGKRPKVRGVAMNPVDHPLGGGEGKSSGGRPPTIALGQARGQEDPAPEEGVHQAHRARTEAREGDSSNGDAASRRAPSFRKR